MKELLEGYGEYLDKKWKLLVTEPVQFDSNGEELVTRAMMEFNLASTRSYGEPKANVTDTDSEQDNNGFLVRYKYGNRKSPNSRQFCKEMTQLASSGMVYTKEEIEKMGKDGVNKDFAKKGDSSYSIWLYKGGGGCKHVWWRQIFSDSTGKAIGRDKARQAGYKEPKNPSEVATPPCTMPNAGFVTKDGSGYKCG